MSFFSSAKKNEEFYLVFDIGSGSVGGALVKNTSGTKPTIIFSTREQIVFQENLDFIRFEETMMKSLKIVAEKIHAAKPQSIKTIQIFLNTPWCGTETRVLKLSKNTPFIFTQKMADELISRERARFEQEQKSKYAELGTGMKLLEARTLAIALNGYISTAPFGKKTEDVALTLFMSISPETLVKNISETLASVWHGAKVECSSFLYASLSIAESLFLNEKEFMLLLLGSELTDIAIIKNGVLSNVASFPFGRNFLARSIMPLFGKTIEEIQSVLAMYNTNALADTKKQELKIVLDKVEHEWLSNFTTVLEKIANATPLPSKIILMSDEPDTVWFADVVKREAFSQYMLTDKRFTIIPFEGTLLRDHCSNIASECDPLLLIEAIFQSKFQTKL